MTVIAFALSMMTSTFVNVGRLGPANRETATALDAARSRLEQVRSATFTEIFARYNADPADDPGGAGTAPGPYFAVPYLDLRPGDADGFVGEITFPTVGAELREDVDDRDLGLPRDLDLDGAVDALDHAANYQLIPVRIRLEWRNGSGDRSLELHSTIVAP